MTDVDKKPYYLAYESRYQKVYAAGIDRWGHSPDDEALADALESWVSENDLRGKRIIDFACGEGACGEILAPLGCRYLGVDISPTVVERTARTLAKYTDVKVRLLDMVNEKVDELFDAAVDCMGFHMLVLDGDREEYLKNAFECLRPGAPMLFFRQLHDENALSARIETMEQWLEMTGNDYTTPALRSSGHAGDDKQADIPLIPGRSQSRKGYESELSARGSQSSAS